MKKLLCIALLLSSLVSVTNCTKEYKASGKLGESYVTVLGMGEYHYGRPKIDKWVKEVASNPDAYLGFDEVERFLAKDYGIVNLGDLLEHSATIDTKSVAGQPCFVRRSNGDLTLAKIINWDGYVKVDLGEEITNYRIDGILIPVASTYAPGFLTIK